jgi:hypothetical protein
MPCWEIRQTSVNMEKADPTILDAALKAISVTSYTFDRGIVTITGWQRTGEPGSEAYSFTEMPTAQQVKVAYGQQVVKVAAKRFGWTINTAKSNPAQRRYVVNKR